MSVVNRTFGLINRGRNAETPTVLMNIPKLDEYLYGVRQGYYYLVGGDTGTGKSKFIRSVFIDNVYEQVLRVNDPTKLDALFVDFTLEIPQEMNIAGTLTRKIFADYDRVLPVEKIFSWTNKLGNDDYTLVNSYRDFIAAYQEKLIAVEKTTDPNLFHAILLQIAKEKGVFEVDGDTIDDCENWTPNNPNLYIIVTFDTMNLAGVNSTYNYLKLAIDQISKTAVKFRNKCNFIFVGVQQFNSDIVSTDRSRFGSQGPVLKDFMDSTGPTKDATVVLGLYSPMRYVKEEQKSWRGYDVETLKSWLISVHVMKNRYGPSGKFAAMKFDGAVGTFEQLPEAINMTPEEYVKATRH